MQKTLNNFKNTDQYKERHRADWLSNKHSYMMHRDDLIAYIGKLEEPVERAEYMSGLGDYSLGSPMGFLYDAENEYQDTKKNFITTLQDLYDQANFVYESVGNNTRGNIVKMSMSNTYPQFIKKRNSYLASIASDMSYLGMKIEKLRGKKYIGKKKNYQPSHKEEMLMYLTASIGVNNLDDLVSK